MKLGIIVHVVPKTNVFIVDVGWGQLRYFIADKIFKIKDIILYEKDYFDSVDTNKIKFVCRLEDCDYQGNKVDEYSLYPSESEIVIARRKMFIYSDHKEVRTFDKISNSLLFLFHAKPRWPLPNEKDFLNAYSYARKKVEELDIPQMIEELKVEVVGTEWLTRRSEGIWCYEKEIRDNYSGCSFLSNDHYLSSIFPRYLERLYESKDDVCKYIHPKYTKMKINRKPDDSIEIVKEKFCGVDIDIFCTNKTKELRRLAWENYDKYNKEEHINSLAYSQSSISLYNMDNELILKMKGLAEVIWGFNHYKLFGQINEDNYSILIENNNKNHPVPSISDEE